MRKIRPGRAVMYILLTLHLITNIFPLWWVFNTSFRKNDEIYIKTIALPKQVNIGNYIKAWDDGNIGTFIPNSILTVLITVVGTVLLGSMAAYVCARFWKSTLLYGYLSMGLMVPVHVLLVPEKLILMKLGLTSSRLGIILVYLAFYFSLAFLLVFAFVKGVPRELEEAAAIDGSNRARTFFTIVLPVAKPGLATAAVMVAYQSWNEYLLPLCLITQNKIKLVSQGLQELKGEYGTDYGLMTAGIMITIIPIIIIYAFFEKYIISGVASGALKG